MVYPHFLKFLHNVELENVFPLLAKEFGCRRQAPPGQAEEKAMRRGASVPPGPFITEPVPLFWLPCLVTPPKPTCPHPGNRVKEAEVCFKGGPCNSKIRAPERRPM